MSAELNANPLATEAARAAADGRAAEAEQLWRQVRARDPANKQALFALTLSASARGELSLAAALAEELCAAAPSDPFAWLTLARIGRAAGDDARERDAIDRALAIDAYCAPGVLAKAAWTERHGTYAEAIRLYRAALKISPPEAHWPTGLRTELDEATRKSRAYGEALCGQLSDGLADQLNALPRAAAERWREAIAIRSGLAAPSHSQSNQFCVPRLPAIPFFERSSFSWAGALESQTDVIAAELRALMADACEGFTPYISYKRGEPMNQFAPLNQSKAWSAFHLYRYGARIEENCARAPATLRALDGVDLANMPGCPNVMFSLLAPHTHIPPHHGETNARVVAHLPLIVPEGCRYRVGFETRSWVPGELLVFDDTIEHEARNDSDEWRAVLLFDVWNPLLSHAERRIAASVLASSA